MSKQNSAETSASKQVPPPTIVSWSIRVICIAALFSLLGFFVYHAVTEDKPIQFTYKIDQEQTKIINDKMHVHVITQNNGDESAERVILKLEVPGINFSQEQTFKIVGPHEAVRSTFIVDSKVQLDQVKLSITSYIRS